MAEAHELVSEFRSIVDDEIAKHDPNKRSWTKYKQAASVGELIFSSYDLSDRDKIFKGESGHIWSVSMARYRLKDRIGSLVIASNSEEPNQLNRNWMYQGRLEIPVYTVKSITDNDNLNAILDWVKSPDLNRQKLDEVAVMSVDEAAIINNSINELADKQRKQDQDSAEIERVRRDGWDQYRPY